MKATNFMIFGVLALILGAMPLSLSADTLAPPQQVIKVSADKLQAKLQDKTFIQNFSKVNQFVNEVIYPHTDFDKISALVLGKLWKTATEEERERFKHEFQTLLVRTYSRAFVEFKEWSVHFLPMEAGEDANKAIVKTEVLQPGLQPVAVNYRMFLAGDGKWKAYDITIEGVSLVTNYRTTFTNEVETKGSLSAVIDGLAKRNAEALSGKSAANS
ncbi:MAG: ABC transporter substrate-binding protein [Methylococcales bacterium]|nr:ABC transporter substrate-binding protein [Methylococcaceae bacterium]